MGHYHERFSLKKDIIDVVFMLSTDSQAELFKVILQYVNNEDYDIEDVAVKIAFEFIKPTIENE